jgi:UPF0755 protein
MLRFAFISIIFLSLIGILFGYAYYVTNIVPSGFPIGSEFTVGENESLRSVSLRLEKEHYINSALWFRTWVSSMGKDRVLQLGNYHFEDMASLGAVVKKFVEGTPDKPLLQVTIPEGSTVEDIANLLHKTIPTISVEKFKQKVAQYKADGKLFPSTYFLLPSHTEDEIIKMMTETFDKKYASMFVQVSIPEPLTSVSEVISLAAILEGEAKSEEDMRIVAGILLSRLKRHMPLQVDVDKATYTTKGVPVTPINNPGLVAMSAVFHASSSPYLFYLTGKDGVMHYAKTFEEHKRNIAKYLK